ncbi:BRCT domain-containing protein [Corynebacterium bovis]|uniref:BRCT domain-containing protein n=2 Tax=Corynebacterium bovis TaxID=36808 RepID=A0A3R8REH9_9CORY|nr:BRCT domain-containing protein [Corynebacterium bovis]RRO87038.1 hypothetical protein CXF48_04185 [Corynebacterium bovis]RRO90057.1 hypothetical protein CXF30_01515 [Corynebacterium bovis]
MTSASTFPAHGATVTVTAEGVTVERTPMGSTVLPRTLHVAAGDLRGWRHHAPTSTSAGWVQLLTDRPTRPPRSAVEAATDPDTVRLDPGDTDGFTAVTTALTRLQGGYLAAGEPAPEGPAPAEATPAGPTPDPAAPTPATDPAAASSRPSGRAPWARVATPDTVPEPNPDADIDNPVHGQNVTVTGDTAPYEKGEIWDMIAAAGGTVGKNVTKKTTILVLGRWDSVTSKEKKAREYIDRGQDIALWTLDEFLDRVGAERRPSIDDVRGTDAPF